MQLYQLLPFEPVVGMRVLGNYNMAGQHYPGVIASVDGLRLFIRYDDGDAEWTTARALVLPIEPTGPDARPTSVSHGTWWNGNSWSRNRLIWSAVTFGGVVLWLLWRAIH